MKRIVLFLLTNLAVMLSLAVVLAVVTVLFGEQTQELFGAWSGLVLVALVYGVGASLVSLLLSKPIAKLSTGAKVVTGEEGEAERWLVSTVEDLARRAGIGMPEVAIYPGAANAFATGAFRNSALVAVSTDIMGQMSKEELRAVLGHEISHVANGDMVTLCLVQGVLNAFVIVFSRVLASAAANAGEGGRRRSNPAVYYAVYFITQIVFSLRATLIVCAFSRRREFAADAGSARLLGTPSSMAAALRRLGNLQPGVLPDSIRAFGIASGKRHASLFATHPSIEDRIDALNHLEFRGV